MAGVKITDLGTLTTAVDADLLYIVDVSDTSQSPQGTSKQIEVGNMFSSGSYIPTISAQSNLTVNANAATFIRVGNVANVAIQLEISLDIGSSFGQFEIELPVASDFTTIKQCFGLLQWSFAGVLADIVELSIGAETTNNTCSVTLETSAPSKYMPYCTIQFQYEIV